MLHIELSAEVSSHHLENGLKGDTVVLQMCQRKSLGFHDHCSSQHRSNVQGQLWKLAFTGSGVYTAADPGGLQVPPKNSVAAFRAAGTCPHMDLNLKRSVCSSRAVQVR